MFRSLITWIAIVAVSLTVPIFLGANANAGSASNTILVSDDDDSGGSGKSGKSGKSDRKSVV